MDIAQRHHIDPVTMNREDEITFATQKFTKKHFLVMYKTLRKILNEERATQGYTQDQVRKIMAMAREALMTVTLE